MIIPRPDPGLVVRYSYLWLSEYRSGREEGAKDRPCLVVLSLVDPDGTRRVTVVPITHSRPFDPSSAIELPTVTRTRLGLDNEKAWIVLSEGNEFIWPGPDLRPVPVSDPSTIAYGFVPPGFFAVVRERFLALARRRKLQQVTRTE